MAVGEIPPPLFFERRALVSFKACALCRSGDSIFRNTPETDQRWPQSSGRRQSARRPRRDAAEG